MKSMYIHWGLYIPMNINCLSVVLGSFWAVWRGLFWCLKAKHWSWQFPRYQQFNKQCKKAKLQARIKPTALCSAIDKKNSIESLLDFLHYLYNYHMVCALLSHAYHVTLWLPVMWSWLYNTFPHSLLCSKSKIKEKEKKYK